MKAFVPWLAVLATVVALNAMGLRPLAGLVAVGWLIFCVYTWIHPGRQPPST